MGSSLRAGLVLFALPWPRRLSAGLPDDSQIRETPKREEASRLVWFVWCGVARLPSHCQPNRRQRAADAGGRSQRPSWPGCSLLRLLGSHSVITRTGSPSRGKARRPCSAPFPRHYVAIQGRMGGLDDSPTPVPRSIELSALIERSGLTLPMIWTPLPAVRWASWEVV